jgi:hypothetical protein
VISVTDLKEHLELQMEIYHLYWLKNGGEILLDIHPYEHVNSKI